MYEKWGKHLYKQVTKEIFYLILENFASRLNL